LGVDQLSESILEFADVLPYRDGHISAHLIDAVLQKLPLQYRDAIRRRRIVGCDRTALLSEERWKAE
jgi:hypothetical protein